MIDWYSMSHQTPATREASWWRRTGIFVVAIITLLAAGSFFVNGTSLSQSQPFFFSEETEMETETPKIAQDASENNTGRILADTGSIDPFLLKSENFRVGDIVVGGDVNVISGIDNDRYLSLQIVSIRGEGMPDKNKKDARILVTWKTSKSAISTIRFGKNTGGNTKTIEEDGFGVNHSAVLSGLDQATTYVYIITVKDRWGNELTSDAYAVYTGAKNVSLFELISNALSDTFGWALKR